MKRSSQGRESEIELALAEVMAKATASGPSLAAISFSRRAISSSASSQLTRCQPGSRASLGRVRRSGYKSRSLLCTISGAARPLGQRAPPVGCAGFGLTSTRRPFSTTLIEPQRERDRKSVVAGKRGVVRVDIGGGRHIKKKKNNK